MTIPFRHLTEHSIGWRELGSSPLFLCLSGTFGFGGSWGLLEGAERLGCEMPSKSTTTPSTLTLVGERLEDDESSFRAKEISSNGMWVR